jgi:hypothetical protein
LVQGLQPVVVDAGCFVCCAGLGSVFGVLVSFSLPAIRSRLAQRILAEADLTVS